MNTTAILAGRLGLALIFILAGLGKTGDAYAGTQQYMEAMGVSGSLLPLVIFAEVTGGLAIAGGFLVLAAHGAGKASVDGWLAGRRGGTS